MGRASRLRPERLPEKLRQIRLALGLSQNEMLRELGLDDLLYRNNVSGFELGEREPAMIVVLRYAEAAGVWTDVLINDDLDLPEKLPCSPKHPGVARSKTPARQKRKKSAE